MFLDCKIAPSHIYINTYNFYYTHNLKLLIMFLASSFKIVLEVAKQGTFVDAARVLGISGPAVSKQIKQLETQLGFVIFNRTTRSVVLTEAGKQLTECLDRSHDEMQSLLQQLSDHQERPSGKLKINAPMAFGERFLVSPIADYALLYPDVVVDVEFSDNRVHLVEEGYDLIIRIGKLEDSGLVAKRLSNFSSLLCASPAFLSRHGTPQSPDELKQLPAVIYSNAAAQISYQTPEDKTGMISLNPAIYANSMGMLVESTLKGVGFARLPAFACGTYLSDGRLIQLLPDHRLTPEMGIYAIYPDRRYLPLKVRKFIDLLSEHLSHQTAAGLGSGTSDVRLSQ